MARFFDRWFTKNPKFDDATTIIERSFDELVKKNKLHEEAWGFGHLDRWDLGPVDKLIGPEADGGDVYEAEVAC